MPDAAEAKHLPFASIALLLQGGGALGAYQGGVYQGLAEANILPDWVAGISIGAINAAIIAGNPPERRVARLREFWEGVTEHPWTGFTESLAPFLAFNGDMRRFLNQASATQAVVAGVPGFFEPRMPPPYLFPPGAPGPVSYYDTKPLKATLERLIDFDRLNQGKPRFSIGAVNICTGNFVYFDTATGKIRPEHIMASGALPPGFPAVEIDGEYYWDGGLVSNTPLQWVLEDGPRQDTLAFQVDLWSSRGKLPANLAEVMIRQKEIQYSSRTRAATDSFEHFQKIRHAVGAALAKVPDDLASLPEFAPLKDAVDHSVYNIVHLIYRSRRYETGAKDFEFSRVSMEEHWHAGYRDAVATLRQKEIFERPKDRQGVFTFDIGRAQLKESSNERK